MYVKIVRTEFYNSRNKIAMYPNLKYIIGEEEDMGISLGRNLALQEVRTEYFLLLDDDNLFTQDTNLEMLVTILDTTDATLAGGVYEGYNYKEFASFLKFGYAENKKTRRVEM